MVRAIRSRLTYANVMITVVAFLALGGSSWAAFGPQGRSVRVRVLVREGFTQLDPTISGGAAALCHAGEIAVGGGAQFVPNAQTIPSRGPILSTIQQSSPSDSHGNAITHGTPRGWVASIQNNYDGSLNVTVHAVCFRP